MSDSGESQEVESNYSGRLSLVLRSTATSACLLTHGTLEDCRKTFFGNQFSTFDSPRDHPQGVHPCAPQRERGSVPQATKQRHYSNADIWRKAVDYEFYNSAGITAEFHGWTAKTADIETSIQQIPQSPIIFCWKTRIRSQMTACSDFPSEAMLWIKEVEMVDSLEELKSSRSVSGKNFRIFRSWTRRLPLL